MRQSLLILFVLSTCLAVTACGQKGPLKPLGDAPKTQSTERAA